jgi:hypothetical protein
MGSSLAVEPNKQWQEGQTSEYKHHCTVVLISIIQSAMREVLTQSAVATSPKGCWRSRMKEQPC